MSVPWVPVLGSQCQHQRRHHTGTAGATDPVYIDCGRAESPQGTLPRLLARTKTITFLSTLSSLLLVLRSIPLGETLGRLMGSRTISDLHVLTTFPVRESLRSYYVIQI